MTDIALTAARERTAGLPLSTPRVCGWAFVGGLLVVLSDASLFQTDTIQKFLAGPLPQYQILGFLISCVIIAGASIVWALVHRPIYEEKIALQLGIIAPAAISAMLAAGAPAQAAAQDATTLLGQVGRELVIGSAFAQQGEQAEQPVETTEPSQPGPLECLLGGLIRRPC